MMLSLLAPLAFATPPPLPFEPPRDCRPGLRAPRPPTPPDTLASKTHPILVHYDAASGANQAAMAAQVLAAVETSWNVQVDTLGFEAPVLPDQALGPEFDIYLIEYSVGAAFVANDGWIDSEVGDGLSSTSSYMVVDNRLPQAWIDSYLAHEFNHACQYATDFTELTFPIWEGTATAAQDWTFGDDGFWDLDVASFQEASAWPSLVANGSYTWYGGGVGWYFEYGAALWVMFLDEKYGSGDGTKGAELWANAANEGFGLEPDAVDAFAATAGTTVGDGLNHLAVVRFLTGDDWDPRGLEDAADWGPHEAVPALALSGDALPWASEPLAVQPMITGQVFVDVDLSTLPAVTGGAPWLDVAIHSPTAVQAGLAVLWWDDAGQVGDESDWGVDPTVSLPSEGLTRVVVAATNLGPTGWDGDDDPYRFADFELSIVPRLEPDSTTDDPNTTDTATSGETGDTSDTGVAPTDDGDLGNDTVLPYKKCGCASGVPSSPLGVVGILLLVARRRPSRTSTQGVR